MFLIHFYQAVAQRQSVKKLRFISFKNSQIILLKGRKVVYLIMQHITETSRNQMCFSPEASGFTPNPEAWSEGNHYKNHYVYTAKKKRHFSLL